MNKQSYNNLQKELQTLEAKLPTLQKNFMDAVDEGDGQHDNLLWQRTKEDLDRCNEKIVEIKEILRLAEITEDETNNGVITIGSKVIIEDQENNKKEIKIVEDFEVNPSLGNISKESNLGKALVDKKINESIQVETPLGIKIYRIVKII